MGKQRRQRKKFHQSSVKENVGKNEAPTNKDTADTAPILHTSDNIFAGLNININSITKHLNDDAKSVKSFKSLKSELGQDKAISKKDKIKLRRQMFLKKLDMVNQLKKENKLKKKRKNVAIIGDTNPLHDALPSLESLLKSRPNISYPSTQKKVKKGIEKSSKQKKNIIQGVNVYKQIMKSKTFQKNPLGMISEHIKAVVEFEKSNLK